MTTTESSAEAVESAGEIFDPEIHATDRKGNPSLNKDGTYRKKRRDAGGARRAARSAAKSTTRASSGKSSASARDRYHKAVGDAAALPVAAITVANPVLGYAAGELVPVWQDALADLAVERPEFAAGLERVGSLGAVGGVAMAGLLTFATFANLAGKIPPQLAQTFGLKSKAEIEQILRQRGEELAARQAAAQAAAGQHDRADAAAAEWERARGAHAA